jgi:hypothetical protein
MKVLFVALYLLLIAPLAYGQSLGEFLTSVPSNSSNATAKTQWAAFVTEMAPFTTKLFGSYINNYSGVSPPWSDMAGFSGFITGQRDDGFWVPSVAGGELELGLSLSSPGDSSILQSYTDVANGLHDAQYNALFSALAAAGPKVVIFRPEWEFNFALDGAPTGTQTAFKNAFSHVYTLAHSFTTNDPSHMIIKIFWCPAHDTTSTPMTALYPGDAFVDLIGGDFYGGGSPYMPDSFALSTTGYSVYTAARFAALHGKPFAIGELGVSANAPASTDTTWPDNVKAALTGANVVAGLTIDHFMLWSDAGGGSGNEDWTSNTATAAHWQSMWSAIVATYTAESPPDTLVTTVGPSINASPTPGSAGTGNALTITAGAQIALNGTVLGGANVIALYYNGNHTAYQQNTSLNWFGPITASGTGSAVADPRGTESPNGTAITTVGPSINASPTPGVAGAGNILTITAGGQIALGGAVLGGAAVTELYYTNHTAYQFGSGLWFGPITATSTGTQVADPRGTISNGLSDLSSAVAHPVTGLAGKVAYSIDISPTNISGAVPDSPIATMVPIWNAYFGSAAGSVPVANLEVGCSCDGSNGSLTDDQAFMTAWTIYANGLASGGPTFTTSQQPMSNSWLAWGNFPGSNPNGTLNTDGTTLKLGQQTYWSTLLFGTTSGPPPPPQTTWNPGDETAITLTNNNKTATTSTTKPNGVRSTTSKSSGLFCWAVTASTIQANWVAGVANSSWAFGGGTAQSIDVVPADGQAAFTNNVFLTGGSSNSASGEEIDFCANFNSKLLYFSDPTMVSASGAGSWNNSNTCNPTVAGCGLSFSGMIGPYFIGFYDPNGEANAVAALNTTGPFVNAVLSSLPSGYSTWDNAAALSSGRPIAVIITGSNDNHRPASNDNAIRVALNNRSMRP